MEKTDAVYGKVACIFCRLWRVGRAIVASLIDGCKPLVLGDIPWPSSHPENKA
jgi:hypothetical protein